MSEYKTVICAIGDEIVDGRIVDTNSSQIARHFIESGIEISRHVCIPDTIEAIFEFFGTESENYDLIITTGGLGPTADDRTRNSLAKALDWEFFVDKNWLAHLVEKWSFPEGNLLSQASIPRGAHLIPNANGTSCGFIKEHHLRQYVFLPGVPNECLGMLESITTYLHQCENITSLSLTKPSRLFVHGIYEREINETLVELTDSMNLGVTWGLYPGLSQVQICLYGPNEECEAITQKLKEKFVNRFYSGNLAYDFRKHMKSIERPISVSGMNHAMYLAWLINSSQHVETQVVYNNRLSLDSDTFSIDLRLDQKNHHILTCFRGTEQVYCATKNVVGKTEEVLSSKSAHWVLSELLYWLKTQ